MATITYTDKVEVNQNTSIPDINKVNARDMNEIKSVVNENASNLDTATQTTSQQLTDLYSGIDNSNTNVKIYKRNNIVHFSGVVYFTASPEKWTKLIQLPTGYYGNFSCGFLIEESTGIVRPIVIQPNGEVQLTANISSTPIYAYIAGELIL